MPNSHHTTMPAPIDSLPLAQKRYARLFRSRPSGTFALVLVAGVALAACDQRGAPAVPKPVVATAAVDAVAPVHVPSAPVSAQPSAPATAAPATAPVSASPSALAPADAKTRKIPLNVQGVAEAGVTVRVKGAEIGGDATVLDVSISFANRITNSTMLALTDTYLEDEQNERLHIKRPVDNRKVTIREGQTLDGQLVFMGRVSSGTRMVTLVFNDGNDSDNIVAPGLRIQLPLPGP